MNTGIYKPKALVFPKGFSLTEIPGRRVDIFQYEVNNFVLYVIKYIFIISPASVINVMSIITVLLSQLNQHKSSRLEIYMASACCICQFDTSHHGIDMYSRLEMYLICRNEQ